MKLKQARDRIKIFIGKKNKDIQKLDEEIKEKLPAYEETKNKKPLVPLLKAKKELMKAVEQGDVRLQLVNDKLAEVEMNQVNKEVNLLTFRPLMLSMIPINTSRKLRRLLRTRIGLECWLMLRISIQSIGLMIVRRCKRILLSRRCGLN